MPSSAVRELLKCWLPGADEISGNLCCECQEGLGRTAARMQEKSLKGGKMGCFLTLAFSTIWAGICVFVFVVSVNAPEDRRCQYGASGDDGCSPHAECQEHVAQRVLKMRRSCSPPRP